MRTVKSKSKIVQENNDQPSADKFMYKHSHLSEDQLYSSRIPVEFNLHFIYTNPI